VNTFAMYGRSLELEKRSPGGLSTQASTPTKWLMRNGRLSKRLAITDRSYKHHAPGAPGKTSNVQMNTFLVIGTAAVVVKEV